MNTAGNLQRLGKTATWRGLGALLPLLLSMATAWAMEPVRPAAHALIIANSEYGRYIPKLLGVRHDLDNARRIARALGVPDGQMVTVADADLAGMRAALDALEQRVLRDDEVFFYYSGHGGRTLAGDRRLERCAEALLGVDGGALVDSELESRLERIAAKARRLVVFLDACHAGGVTRRTLEAGPPRFQAKYWSKAGDETCSRPSNVLTRGLAQAKPGSGKLNYVHIAAARSDEAALDDSQLGGLATSAWLDCLEGRGRDLDASTSLSVAELAACAQPLIEARVREPGLQPQHLTLHGNTALPVRAAFDAGAVDALAVLRDIHAGRDDRRVVRLTLDQPRYRIGQDPVRFSIDSSHAGYLYLLMVGSDGRTFDLLFPNRKDVDNHIAAGETLTLPRAGWRLKPGGPAGTDHLLALVSDTPRDFEALGMRAAGPFSLVQVSQSSSQNLRRAVEHSTGAGQPACTGDRDLSWPERCSSAYGADLVPLLEVP